LWGAIISKPEESFCRLPWKIEVPAHQAMAVAQIQACVDGKSILVKDLKLDGDVVKIDLVRALHEWGVAHWPAAVLFACGLYF
jgi:hypothetical protein